jgi:hypothetical protein
VNSENEINVIIIVLYYTAHQGKKGKAVPLHAVEALGGEEV